MPDDKIAKQKKIAAALKRLESMQRTACFDPIDTKTRPTDAQQDILDDLDRVNYRYAMGGNQCLAEGTLVLTDKGPVPIEDIRIGDTVYSETGTSILVKEVYSNGKKEVVELTNRGQLWAESTSSHTFLTGNTSRGDQSSQQLRVEEFSRDTSIHRVEVNAPLGTVEEPHAYSIGVFLGVSSGDEEVIAAVAEELGVEEYTKSTPHCNHYDDWCRGRYAHEKIVDIDIIKSWNRDSLLRYVAGVIDTDGSVYVDTWDNINITLEMQAKSVVESVQYAFLALWQTSVKITEVCRDKYVNGPTQHICIRNNAYTQRMLRELDQYLRVPHKKWKPEYETFDSKRTNPDRIGIKKGNYRYANTYDIHVDSPTNLYLLGNGLVTHNSGKTQLGAREVSWIFQDNHPNWERPVRWGDEPTQILVLGRTTKQIEEVIWRKIERLLEPGCYKVSRTGGTIQKVTHRTSGNTILFLSHHSDKEAREKVQAFVAHYAWLDEMPGSYQIIEEIHRRVQKHKGYFLATFTPKSVNEKIRKMVDSADGVYSKKYKLKMFDNPSYDEDSKKMVLASLVSASASYKKTVLDGDWAVGEEMVYEFVSELMVERPVGYSPTWRHVESVDPALKSKFGLTIWAEDPKTQIWYCVRAEYIEGIFDPVAVLAKAQDITSAYNIVRRVSDPHEAWYLGTASSAKIKPGYVVPWSKNNRKGELIKGLQTALTSGKVRIAPWCEDLISEFQDCRWSESAETAKIVNSSSFHLLDTAQYFVDLIPKPEHDAPQGNWQDILYRGNEKRKTAEASAQKASKKAGTGRRIQVKRKSWNISR